MDETSRLSPSLNGVTWGTSRTGCPRTRSRSPFKGSEESRSRKYFRPSRRPPVVREIQINKSHVCSPDFTSFTSFWRTPTDLCPTFLHPSYVSTSFYLILSVKSSGPVHEESFDPRHDPRGGLWFRSSSHPGCHGSSS